VDINLRNQEDQNLWLILTAQSHIEEFNEQVLEEVFNIENVVAKLLDNLGQNCTYFLYSQWVHPREPQEPIEAVRRHQHRTGGLRRLQMGAQDIQT